MGVPSEALQRFLESVTAPLTRTNLEDYDLGAMRNVEPEERAAVEDVLADRLAAGDGRAASALAELASPRAIQILKQGLALPVPRAAFVATARALGQLGDDAGEAPLLDALEHGNAFERKMAASGLRYFHSGIAEAALLKAMSDVDAGVRGNAFGALVVARGLKPYDGSYRDRIGLTYPLLGSPLAAVRSIAIDDVRELLARLDAGDSPATLDLAPVDDSQGPPARWMESLRTTEAPWADDLALDALDALHGRERRWAEDVLLGYLQLDPRAPRAAAHGRMDRAIAALREVMQRYAGAVQIEAAGALFRLNNDGDARSLLQSTVAGADADMAQRAKRTLAVTP
jgi:HEAT repeat protein